MIYLPPTCNFHSKTITIFVQHANFHPCYKHFIKERVLFYSSLNIVDLTQFRSFFSHQILRTRYLASSLNFPLTQKHSWQTPNCCVLSTYHKASHLTEKLKNMKKLKETIKVSSLFMFISVKKIVLVKFCMIWVSKLCLAVCTQATICKLFHGDERN